jgi:hypothetical protein
MSVLSTKGPLGMGEILELLELALGVEVVLGHAD